MRDEHKASGQTGRETARDGGDETARGLMPTTPGRRVSETYEQRRRGLTRMPSRISYSSLKRAVVSCPKLFPRRSHPTLPPRCLLLAQAGTDPMADAAARAIAESSSVYGGDDVEVDDNAYVISPVEVDVTHAIMSQARVLEMQVRVRGAGEVGYRSSHLPLVSAPSPSSPGRPFRTRRRSRPFLSPPSSAST